jgi:hypothetical protein
MSEVEFDGLEIRHASCDDSGSVCSATELKVRALYTRQYAWLQVKIFVTFRLSLLHRMVANIFPTRMHLVKIRVLRPYQADSKIVHELKCECFISGLKSFSL